MGNPRSTTVVRYDFLLLVDFYYLRCLFLLLIDKVCVYLRCTYVLVGKHFADSVYVCTTCNHKGCVGVTEAVESYVLVYTCGFYPGFESSVYELTCETFEYYSFRWFTAQSKSLVANWNVCFGFCLLGFDADAFTTGRVVLYVFPF